VQADTHLSETDETSGKSKFSLTLIGFALVAFVGLLDYLTGYELSFSVFYLIPVSLVGWTVGRTAGMLVALVGALT